MRVLRSEPDEAAQGYIKSEWNIPDRPIAHFSGQFRAVSAYFSRQFCAESTFFRGRFRADPHKLFRTNQTDFVSLSRQFQIKSQECTP